MRFVTPGTSMALVVSCVSATSFAFEPWEHRDAGDRGFESALNGLNQSDRKAVEVGLGAYLKNEGGAARPNLWVGPSGSTASPSEARRWFTYGELISTYGDFRESIKDLRETPADKLNVIHRIIRGDFKPSNTGSDFKPLGKGKGKADGITDVDPGYLFLQSDKMISDEARAFVRLAMWNKTHFSELAVQTYQVQHNLALDRIGESVLTNNPQLFLDALHLEALGHHGLTDIFAAGHMMVDRRPNLNPLDKNQGELKDVMEFYRIATLNWDDLLKELAKQLAISMAKESLEKAKILADPNPLSIAKKLRALKKKVAPSLPLEFKVFLRGVDDGSAHIGYNHKGYQVVGFEDEEKAVAYEPSAFWQSFGDGEYFASIEGKDTTILQAKTARAVELSVRSLFRAYADLKAFAEANSKNSKRAELIKKRVVQWKASYDAFEALKVIPIYVVNPDGICPKRDHDVFDKLHYVMNGPKSKQDELAMLLTGLDELKFAQNATLGYCAKTPTRLPYYPLIKSFMERATFGYSTKVANQAKVTPHKNGGQYRSGVHACNGGLYLTGVRLDQERYLCEAGWGDGVGETTWSKADESGMRTCPRGMAMTGIFAGKKSGILCALLSDEVVSYVDENTQRAGMHACPSGSVLLGVNVDKNHLLCGKLARMKRL